VPLEANSLEKSFVQRFCTRNVQHVLHKVKKELTLMLVQVTYLVRFIYDNHFTVCFRLQV
jgi:hypothetical protein